MTEAQAAHIRLMESGQLEVRTHETPEAPRRTGFQEGKNKGNKWGRSPKATRGVSQAIRIMGKTYPSITSAVKGVHVSTKTLYAMLRSGEAEYVGQQSGT